MQKCGPQKANTFPSKPKSCFTLQPKYTVRMSLTALKSIPDTPAAAPPALRKPREVSRAALFPLQTAFCHHICFSSIAFPPRAAPIRLLSPHRLQLSALPLRKYVLTACRS